MSQTESEFQVLSRLLEEKTIPPGTAAFGIVEQILERGYESLTKRQMFVFHRYVVDPYCHAMPNDADISVWPSSLA